MSGQISNPLGSVAIVGSLVRNRRRTTSQRCARYKANAPEGRGLTIENNNTNGDSCWVYVGSGSASKEESQQLTAGEPYVRYWPFVPSDGIQATCASSSDRLDVRYQ